MVYRVFIACCVPAPFPFQFALSFEQFPGDSVAGFKHLLSSPEADGIFFLFFLK